MSEIKKELWKLSEKMEIEGKSNTIAGQINIMNRALGGDHGTDIADSIKKYTDVASGGEPNFTKIHLPCFYIYNNSRYYQDLFVYYNDGEEVDLNDVDTCVSSSNGIFILFNPVKKITVTGLTSNPTIIFTPTAAFDGVYNGTSGKFTNPDDSESIVTNDGKIYLALVNYGGGGDPTVVFVKLNNNFSPTLE